MSHPANRPLAPPGRSLSPGLSPNLNEGGRHAA